MIAIPSIRIIIQTSLMYFVKKFTRKHDQLQFLERVHLSMFSKSRLSHFSIFDLESEVIKTFLLFFLLMVTIC